MVKKTNATDKEGQQVCLAEEGEFGGSSSGGGQFEWSEQLQGVILGAFFWGYVITHIPGGILSEKFGGKYTLGLGILSTAVFTLITPVVINWGK